MTTVSIVSVTSCQISFLCIAEQRRTEVIKYFTCSTQLSTKFILLINVKMPTIVGILTFISITNSMIIKETSSMSAFKFL